MYLKTLTTLRCCSACTTDQVRRRQRFSIRVRYHCVQLQGRKKSANECRWPQLYTTNKRRPRSRHVTISSRHQATNNDRSERSSNSAGGPRLVVISRPFTLYSFSSRHKQQGQGGGEAAAPTPQTFWVCIECQFSSTCAIFSISCRKLSHRLWHSFQHASARAERHWYSRYVCLSIYLTVAWLYFIEMTKRTTFDTKPHIHAK